LKWNAASSSWLSAARWHGRSRRAHSRPSACKASFWFGVGAPKGTPAEILDKLNKEINAALADANMNARLADLGGTVLPGSPSDFGKHIAEETEKWGKVIRAAGIKAD
jgi:tripartite-type tricarboxylate transporter receptor subunit TctC